MDQGNQALERPVFASSIMSPMRAVLLLLGAVLGGVVLSLLLGASPAQAADGNGGSALDGPLGGVSSVAAGAAASITSAGDELAPLVYQVVHATANSGIAMVPVAAPVVAPLAAAVDAALTATADLVAPLTGEPIVGPEHAGPALRPANSWIAPTAGAQPGIDLPTTADEQRLGTLGGDVKGSMPGPILSAGSAAPAAVLAVLPAIIGVALLGSRRHLDDDALPASPTFETDTSPA